MPRVTSLIVRFKGGSHSAYHALFHAYFPGVVASADRHLGAVPLGLVDAEDIALSAFHGLWREVADGRPLRDGLTDRDSLLRTLNLLTTQKVCRACRHAGQMMRDASRTIRETDLMSDGPDIWDAIPDPTPQWRSSFWETWDELMAVLSPRQRTVAEWRFAGHTNAEIARHIGRSVRAVERELSEIRSIWEERFRTNGI